MPVFDRQIARINRRGVTLVEIVIVLLIMGILSAIAVPKWVATLQRYRVENSAKRIVADLARAQTLANSTSTSKVVTFDVTNHRYTLDGVADLNHPSATYTVSLRPVPYESRLVSVWGAAGSQTITFDGYGLPSRGGEIVVSAGTVQRTITVDAATGTAVMQ